MPKIKKVKKLWQGKYVSIRDYEIKDGISKGGIEIKHNDQVMFLSPDQLTTLKPSGKVHQSKFTGTYQLVDITWTPLKNDPRQGDLLELVTG